MEWQQELKDPREFLNMVKVDLYPEEVYCFTPQGQVKSFPRGASPIDFAYSVHTEVGHRCVGSRINGKLQPLRTELKNGDIVEILTSPNHHPSQDWLTTAKTPRARAKIRQKLDPQARVHETAEGPIAHAVKKALGMSGRKVTVRGLDDALISLARCCNPIRGEPIVGYITRGRGVTVHSERCPNLEKLLYDPERRIEVTWESGDASRFDVRITVFSEDRPGMLAKKIGRASCRERV